MIENELFYETKREVEMSLIDGKDYIDIINKKLESNLFAIYCAVTEIKLNDVETYQKVKVLAEKQECYKEFKKKYLNEKIRVTSVKL